MSNPSQVLKSVYAKDCMLGNWF